MNTFYNYSIALIMMLFSGYVQAQNNYLSINNPNSWSSDQGTIEAATLEIEPCGIYTDVSMYLTFSDANTYYFNTGDSLEAVYYFNLPETAIVHDSWLWVGDEPVQAYIVERNRANLIYETIVSRRQDPSILYKNSKTQYELRVYPLMHGGTRKVKISYLLPAVWSADEVTATLPWQLLNCSRTPLSQIQLLIHQNNEWKNPHLPQFPNTILTPTAENPNILQAQIPASLNSISSVTITYDSPMQNGVYVSRYADNDMEGTYHLAVLPSVNIENIPPKKVLLLLQNQQSNSLITNSNLLQQAKQQCKTAFSDNDLLNVMVSSGIFPEPQSEGWVAATDANIDALFSGISNGDFANYDNSVTLLAKAIDYLNKQGGGEILLLTSTFPEGYAASYNSMLNDLQNLKDDNTDISIDVLDFNTQYDWYYGNTGYYLKSDYFFGNLCALFGGDFTTATLNDWDSNLNKSFELLGHLMYNYDLSTDLEGGFCYGRYSNSGKAVSPQKAILQVGKYVGNMPLQVELSGMLNDVPFSVEYEVANNDIYNDSNMTGKKVWSGFYISELEQQSNSAEVQQEIAQHSIAERVLSYYTAFLCLEPQMSLEDFEDETNNNNNNGGTDEGDDNVLIGGIDDTSETATDLSLLAQPNPFSGQVRLQVVLPIDDTLLEAAIYDLNGRLLALLPINNGDIIISATQQTMEWNNDSTLQQLPKGIYLVKVRTAQGTQTLKLVKV